MQHLRTLIRHLEHLVVTEDSDLHRIGNDSRICGEDSGHIGEDFAALGTECSGHRYGTGIRSSTTQRGDLLLLICTLKPCQNHDLIVGQRLDHSIRVDSQDPSLCVTIIGDDSTLLTSE